MLDLNELATSARPAAAGLRLPQLGLAPWTDRRVHAGPKDKPLLGGERVNFLRR
ncbi:hypothetical protein ACTG9Q_28375 [Actinokineospora sp. 24-640]